MITNAPLDQIVIWHLTINDGIQISIFQLLKALQEFGYTPPNKGAVHKIIQKARKNLPSGTIAMVDDWYYVYLTNVTTQN